MVSQSWIAFPLLLALFSGCAGGGNGVNDLTTAPGANPEDLGLEATRTTGLIVGIVVDEAITPLVDVTVTLRGQDTDTSTITNAAGGFGFDGLPAGSYFLTAEKGGYVTVQSSANAEAGVDDPDPIQIMLQGDPSSRPYFFPYKFDGFLECSIRGVVIGFAACSGYGNDNFYNGGYDLDKVTDWFQSEMVWESSQALGAELSLAIDCLSGPPCPSGQVGIARDEGVSPLVATINRTTAEAFLLGISQPVDIRVFASGRSDLDLIPEEDIYEQMNSTTGGAVPCLEWPVLFDSCIRFRGPGLIVQQKFTVYSHAFYGYMPPEGWLFIESNEVPSPP